MKVFYFAAGVALLASTARGQTSILLADVNQTTVGINGGPTAGKWMNNVYYFAATDAINGAELWKSDGTAAGTMLLKDINVGNGSSAVSNLTVVGSTLFFTANDGVHGSELWKTDGTTAGTELVKDIRSGGSSSQTGDLTALGGKLVFTATDGLTGDELWESNGTTAGTTQIIDLMPGSVGSAINRWASTGTIVYFCASYQTSGNYELWKTDGTSAGTVFVKEVYAGTTGGVTGSFFTHNGILYFGGYQGLYTQLWRSDGTSAGTYELKAYNAGSGGNPSNYAAMGSNVYFSFTDGNGTELWKSDGTVGGTSMVSDINGGSSNSSPSQLTAVGSTLYFRATTAASGQELWKTDGTTTSLVKEINAGTANAAPANLLAWNSALYFAANDGAGLELWKSDGTANGTVLLKDINPAASTGSGPTALVGGSTFFFVTADNGSNGTELFTSDGTTNGTALLKNINPEAGSSAIATMTALGNKVIFNANNGTTGAEPWVTDGTPGGTSLLKDINTSAAAASSSATNFIVYAGKILFRATTGTTAGNTGSELWTTDGTTTGTALLKDINAGTFSSSPANLTLHNGFVYFGASTATEGGELWRTDGTANGTILIKDIVSGSMGSSPGGSTTGSVGMISNGSTLLFQGIDQSGTGGQGWELYSSTGAVGSGGILKDINTGALGANGAPGHFAYPGTGSTVLFVAYDVSLGQELFKTDGTSGGTVMVKDITAGSESTTFTPLIVFNGKVYFTAYDATAGLELWQTDGTTAGTVVLKDIRTGTASSTPLNLTVCGSYLYFSADNGTSGRELWRTDGTTAGTVLVSDINSGSGSSNPAYFYYHAAQQKVFFSAFTPANGVELWQYDGTTSSLYSEAAIGAASSHPGPIMMAGNHLAYVGTNGTTGLELYGVYMYNTWTGTGGTGWGTGTSWRQSLQPTSTEGALIPATGVSAEPSITAADVTVTRLEVAAPRTLTIGAGRTLTATDTVLHFGTLAGTGTLTNAHFRNGGTVAPGGIAGTGILTVTSHFTNAGTLRLEASGTVAGTGYDRLVTGGNLILGGTIELTLTGGYTPIDGQVLPVLTYSGTRSGAFTTTSLPAGWAVVYNDAAQQVQLQYTTPLALDDLQFAAIPVGEDVHMTWSAAKTAGTSNYHVERSLDGRTFSLIGTVAAKQILGTSDYSFTDALAMHTDVAKLYYRLRVQQIDGSTEWSTVAVINLAKTVGAFAAQVAPNPFNDQLRVQLTLPSGGNVTLQLYDLTGKRVAASSVYLPAGRSDVMLPSNNSLSAGVYSLRITTGVAEQALRVVKD